MKNHHTRSLWHAVHSLATCSARCPGLQVRLARALPVHLINFACYAGLVMAQWSGALELGMELRPLLNCAQFLAWVVLLPIAIASILEVRPAPPCARWSPRLDCCISPPCGS